MAGASGGKGNKKYGRNKKKNERKGNPISLFVRGKITAHKYWELTGQSSKFKQKEAA